MSGQTPSLNPKLELGRKVAEVLRSFGIDVPFAPYDFNSTSLAVLEPSCSTAVSEQILDRMFPKSGSTTALHYTSADVLRSVVKNKQLWLAWVQKNIKFDEFTTFATEHGYQGYFDTDATGAAVYEQITRSMFYASFTPKADPDNDDLWDVFGKDEHCLRFKISPGPISQFRRIQYQTGNPTLLKEIDKALQAQVGRVFVPARIAQLCAFYLTQSYNWEDELRLLVPNPLKNMKFDHDGEKYIAIPICADNVMCRIDLIDVYCGSQNLIEPTRKVLDDANLGSVGVHLRPGVGP